MEDGGDLEFIRSIRGAASALGRLGKQLRAAADGGQTSSLIAYLRSDRPLGAIERSELADLIAGEFGARRGRPTRNAEERTRRRQAFYRYKELMQQYKAEGRRLPLQPLAIDRVSSEFKMTRDQVLGLIKDKKMRI